MFLTIKLGHVIIYMVKFRYQIYIKANRGIKERDQRRAKFWNLVTKYYFDPLNYLTWQMGGRGGGNLFLNLIDLVWIWQTD